MRTASLVLVVLVIGVALASADEPEPGKPARQLTTRAAADAVLEAVKDEGSTALAALAAKERPDPWLVANELCYRGEHDAADAFSKAAPTKAVEKLPAYVASRRGKKPNEKARRVLAGMNLVRRQRGGPQRLLELADSAHEPLDSVVGIRIAFGRGMTLQVMRRHQDSATVLMTTGRAAQKLGWFSRASAAFHESGLSAYRGSDRKGALSAWQCLLEVERGLNNKANVARALTNIGSVQGDLGSYPRALEVYVEALGIRRELGDRALVARLLNVIGTLQMRVGKFSAALEAYEEALGVSRELGDKSGVATSLMCVGFVRQSLGALPLALKLYQESLTAKVELGDKLGAAAARAAIGTVHINLGNYQEALASHGASLRALRALDHKTGVATALLQVGTVQLHLGNYAGALARFDESHSIARELGEQTGVAAALQNLASVHQRLGDYPEALRLYTASLETYRALGAKPSVAMVLNNVGNVQRSLGHHEEALTFFEESLETRREMGDIPGIAVTLHNIASLQQDLGRHADALRLYAESLQLFRDVGDKAGVAVALTNIGVAQERLDNYADALEAYEGARRILSEAPAPGAQARVAWGLAILRLRQDQPAKAVELARRGVEFAVPLAEGLAEGEGAGARDLFAGLFDVGLRATLRAGDSASLLWFLEQDRAGSLREAMGSRAALEAVVIPDDLRKALTLARHGEKAALDAYRHAQKDESLKNKRRARSAWLEAQAQVGRASARIQRDAKSAAAVTHSEPQGLAEIRAHLQLGEAMVLYDLTSEAGIALVLARGSEKMVALPASTHIQAACTALVEGDLGIDPGVVPLLRKLLVDPLDLDKEVRRVLVSPTGRLGYVPFALLLPDKEVVYVPSGTTYGLLLEEKTREGERVLGLADPEYDSSVDEFALAIRAGDVNRLTRLPETRKEVEAIADVGIFGANATEAGLQAAVKKQERWRAVHIACHGLIDPDRPLLSALALTSDDEDDGFLTALEILGMKIPADLVVLSACETGKGRIYKTEGIVGLTRAFMFAGAPRVICSLWKVDDEATQALMIKFYELWNPKAEARLTSRVDRKKGVGAASALKKAQAFIRDHPDHPEWKHPYYWAAWVLWGLPE